MPPKPTIEEVDDDEIDNMDMDIAQFDPSLRTPIAPINKPTVTRSQDSEPPLFPQQPFQPPSSGSAPKGEGIMDPLKLSEQDKEHFAKFQTIYPCYFDINRTHKEGRRVSIDLAVENPLAITISDACRKLGVPVILELDRSHPQDFGNPGRVKVFIKDAGEVQDPRFKTKKGLLNEIASYLLDHPTTLKSISKGGGLPIPKEYEQGFEPEEIPKVKGFKMNSIVPIHSNYTLKHPMTKTIYDPEPETTNEAPKLPKQPKKKIMRVRG